MSSINSDGNEAKMTKKYQALSYASRELQEGGVQPFMIMTEAGTSACGFPNELATLVKIMLERNPDIAHEFAKQKVDSRVGYEQNSGMGESQGEELPTAASLLEGQDASPLAHAMLDYSLQKGSSLVFIDPSHPHQKNDDGGDTKEQSPTKSCPAIGKQAPTGRNTMSMSREELDRREDSLLEGRPPIPAEKSDSYRRSMRNSPVSVHIGPRRAPQKRDEGEDTQE